MENVFQFLRSTITIMIPIFFASLGGLFPAFGGTLNIALEGLLLIGAFSSLAVFSFTGNIMLAVVSAIISAMLLCVLHAFVSFKLRSNIFISGVAINLLSSGLCIVLSEKLFGTKGVISVNGTFGLLNWFVIVALLLFIITLLAIYKTPFGYRLRACEKNSLALLSLGMNPVKYQTTALLISGFFCGIGGSFLSLNLGSFVQGMSAGKGWIALAVIFLGLKKPIGILVAAFVFSLCESFSNYAQGFLSVPADFILAFPYIITLIAIIAVSALPNIRHNI